MRRVRAQRRQRGVALITAVLIVALGTMLAASVFFRGYLDPDSMLLVANPRSRFLGQVNTAPEQVAAVGGQSIRTINVRSHTHEMTRTSNAKKGDETYRLRSGDRFGQYGGSCLGRLWHGHVDLGRRPASFDHWRPNHHRQRGQSSGEYNLL